MNAKQLYEYLKERGLENKRMIIRLDINGGFLDFSIEEGEKNIFTNAYNELIIMPRE